MTYPLTLIIITALLKAKKRETRKREETQDINPIEHAS